MPINPDEVSTVRVGQLPPEAWNLTDLLPHEISAQLKQGTVQGLADLISTYIGAVSSLALNTTIVNDGETLPATTSEEFIFVGKGTFHNVGGGEDIVTTEPLNVLTSNGSVWSLAVAIPVNVELAGIVQTIRSGFTTTTPSENAVYENSQTDFIRNNSDVPGATNSTEAFNYLLTTGANFPKIQIIATAGQTIFPLGTSATANAVFWNGALLNDLDWSQTGTNITTIFPLSEGDLFKPI